MQNKDDGGPAFPQAIAVATGEAPQASYDFVDGSGMSLRDYFAAKALPAEIAASVADGSPWNYDEVARDCYVAADAMLRERAK